MLFKPKPIIYALTAESDETVTKRIRAAGFREIYSFLTESIIEKIFQDADLPYRPVSVNNAMVEFNHHNESSSSFEF